DPPGCSSLVDAGVRCLPRRARADRRRRPGLRSGERSDGRIGWCGDDSCARSVRAERRPHDPDASRGSSAPTSAAGLRPGAGATVLALGRTRPPSTIGRSAEPRGRLSFAGLLLPAVTPLLTGPDRFAIFSFGPADHGTWQAASTTMLDPAHVVLDVAVPMGA